MIDKANKHLFIIHHALIIVIVIRIQYSLFESLLETNAHLVRYTWDFFQLGY